MRSVTESSGECVVYTFKDGLLSPIAHDLLIRVTAFRVEIDEDQNEVQGTFDARSLRVLDAADDGVPRPGALSAADKQKIEQNIGRDVLHADRHPEIRFSSTSVTPSDGGYDVVGQLTLNGRARPVHVTVRTQGESWVAEAALNQPDWGIKPYKALLGTLKVQPVVEVRLSVPR